MVHHLKKSGPRLFAQQPSPREGRLRGGAIQVDPSAAGRAALRAARAAAPRGARGRGAAARGAGGGEGSAPRGTGR